MPYLQMGERSRSLYIGFDGRSRRVSNNLLEDRLLLLAPSSGSSPPYQDIRTETHKYVEYGTGEKEL